MDSSKEIKFSKFVEYFLIVGSGLYLHLNRLSILDLKITKLPGLTPSLASTIFVFSILNIFAIGKPSWPGQAKDSRELIKVFIELSLILYSVEMIMRHFWLPVLKLVSFLCKHTSRGLRNKSPGLSMWIAENGYFAFKLLFAIATLVLMMEVVGFNTAFKRFIENSLKNCKTQKQEITFAAPVAKVEKPQTTNPVKTRSRSRKRVSFEENLQQENGIPLLSKLLTSPRARRIIDLVRLRNHHDRCIVCQESM